MILGGGRTLEGAEVVVSAKAVELSEYGYAPSSRRY
jgi:hypothetical protein